SATEELGSDAGDALGNGKRLLTAFNAAWPCHDRQVASSNARGVPRKLNDRVVGLSVAADQFVGFGDADDFLHAGHFFERAGFDFTLVASNADGGALRPGHRVGAVSERFDLLADGADLLFGGLRLHDYEHGTTSKVRV